MALNFINPPVEPKFDKAKFAVLPVAYDKTATYMKGAAKGPAKIIEASAQVELRDFDTRVEPWRDGIFTIPIVRSSERPERFLPKLEKIYSKYLAGGKTVCMLGGEHSITLSALRAQIKRRGKISVLHLDAHADAYDEYEGTRLGHGCFLRRAYEEGAEIVQAGIRTLADEEIDFIRTNRIPSFSARECHAGKDMPKRLAALLGKKVYVTVDMDAFDVSVAPGVGTPIPGGLGWYQMLDILKHVFKTKEVIGFDVVETMPVPGCAVTEFAAATLAYRMMAYKIAT
jgi:agmatinase